MAESTCKYTRNGSCKLHESKDFGMLLTLVTVGLIAIAIVFDILVLIYVNGMPIYGRKMEEDDDNDSFRQMIDMSSRNSVRNNPQPEREPRAQASLYFSDSSSNPTPLPTLPNTLSNGQDPEHASPVRVNSPDRGDSSREVLSIAEEEEPVLNFQERRLSQSPVVVRRGLLNSDL